MIVIRIAFNNKEERKVNVMSIYWLKNKEVSNDSVKMISKTLI